MVEKSNTQKVLAFFFEHPTKIIHLRELSREMKLSMPAILSAVKKLHKERLVAVQKGKVLTTVQAKVENSDFIRLKRVHNLEAIYTSKLVEAISKASGYPQAIICFGSYSRGEDLEGSDIDIAIIEKDETEMEVDKFEKALKRRISLHYVDLKKVSEEFKSNLCNGIVLEGAL